MQNLIKKRLKSKKAENPNQRILVISDMHIPYNHLDAFEFLEALHKKYNFTKIVNIGDEVDNHAISYHDSDPDLPSAGDELKRAIIGIQRLHRMFPTMDVIKSNHGNLFERKIRTAGLPQSVLKPRNTIYQLDDGWTYYDELVLEMPNGEEVLFHHGLSANGLTAAKEKGMSLCQGHFHTKFAIGYWRTKKQLSWALSVGCLIDRHSLAMLYAREGKMEQIIGCGGIIDSQPRLFPMQLNRDGRWNGDVP